MSTHMIIYALAFSYGSIWFVTSVLLTRWAGDAHPYGSPDIVDRAVYAVSGLAAGILWPLVLLVCVVKRLAFGSTK